MTLTEQLNKGELPSGLYYIKDSNENIYIDECVPCDNKEIDVFIFAGMEVKEVLAKVPSYIDWQNMVNRANEEQDKVKKQLEIAIKALNLYKNFLYDGTLKGYETIAKEALLQIKELNNGICKVE